MSAPVPRRYRHRGPRRASGGTWTDPVAEGEGPAAERGASAEGEAGRGTDVDGAGDGVGPGGSRGSAAERDAARASAPLDERGRWLLEERPPHWG